MQKQNSLTHCFKQQAASISSCLKVIYSTLFLFQKTEFTEVKHNYSQWIAISIKEPPAESLNKIE